MHADTTRTAFQQGRTGSWRWGVWLQTSVSSSQGHPLAGQPLQWLGHAMKAWMFRPAQQHLQCLALDYNTPWL